MALILIYGLNPSLAQFSQYRQAFLDKRPRGPPPVPATLTEYNFWRSPRNLVAHLNGEVRQQFVCELPRDRGALGEGGVVQAGDRFALGSRRAGQACEEEITDG